MDVEDVKVTRSRGGDVTADRSPPCVIQVFSHTDGRTPIVSPAERGCSNSRIWKCRNHHFSCLTSLSCFYRYVHMHPRWRWRQRQSPVLSPLHTVAVILVLPCQLVLSVCESPVPWQERVSLFLRPPSHPHATNEYG